MSDNTEREAAQRYPDNPHLNYVPFYAQLKREGFAAGAEWQRAVDAEEIARLQAEVESWKSSNGKNLRYGEFVDDHFERVSAERDALAQQIAAVRAAGEDVLNEVLGLADSLDDHISNEDVHTALLALAGVIKSKATILASPVTPESETN